VIKDLLPVAIAARIVTLRGHRVMLDSDLAELYGVTTSALKQAVRRNLDRFPEDFLLELTRDEADELSRSQFVILKRGENIKFRPFAFTQEGVAMLSGVLRSKQAVQTHVGVNRPACARASTPQRCPHARGGMNRRTPYATTTWRRCPHARGGYM